MHNDHEVECILCVSIFALAGFGRIIYCESSTSSSFERTNAIVPACVIFTNYVCKSTHIVCESKPHSGGETQTCGIHTYFVLVTLHFLQCINKLVQSLS